MKIPSFIGGTDEQRSNNLSDNLLVNLYPVTNNDGSVAAFYKVDGLKSEGTLSGVPTGSYKASNGRAFYTSGTVLYELTVVASVYTSTSRGTITTATNYEFSDNGLEMIMVNGTDGWIFTFSTNALLKLTVLTDTFTVQSATGSDVDATLTQTAHGLIVGDRVILTTTGSLPTYLLTNTVYYVLADGFTADAFKVGLTLTGATCTISNGTPCTVTSASHNFIAGDKIRFLTTGTLPASLAVGTIYYVISAGITQDTFRISLTSGGVAINTTTAGSGVHSFNPAITIIQTGTMQCSISTSTAPTDIACSISVGTPAVITKVAHGLANGDVVAFVAYSPPAQLHSGINEGTLYYVQSKTNDTFQIALTESGSPISTSDAGSTNGGAIYTPYYYVAQQGLFITNDHHNLTIEEEIKFNTTGTLPTGVSTGTTYFVTGISNGTFASANYTNNYYSVGPEGFGFSVGVLFYLTTDINIVSGSALKFKTNGFLPPILNEDTTYYALAAGVTDGTAVQHSLPSGYNIFGISETKDGVRLFSNGINGSGLVTCLAGNSFAVVSNIADIYGTRIATTGAQSGVHSFFSEISESYGTHTYTTAGSGFPSGAKTVSYMNGRFIACDPDTQDFYVSEVLDGKTWDSINVQTVDSNPDYVTGQIVAHNELFVFCENSGETYYDSGTTPTPFVRNLTGIFEVGCKVPYTIKEIGGSIIFLGNTTSGNGIVYQMSGLTPVRISTYSIEYQIQQMSDISDAFAFTYQKHGHHFYVLTFPTGNKTFVFDASTSLWHERRKYFANGALGTRTDYLTNLGPHGLTISPDGNYLYAINSISDNVSMYPRNTTTGVLGAKTDYATGSLPYVIAISPNGESAYITSYNSNTISLYPRDTVTGELGLRTNYATGTNPYEISISPDGNYVYVINITSDTVSMYPRNTTTGTLGAKTDYATGDYPNGISMSADGTSIYIVNFYADTVSMYPRNTITGVLGTKTDYATGSAPYDVTISPDGTSVYAVNLTSSTVSMYERNTTTGTLGAKTDYATGLNPEKIDISANGEIIYVSNAGADTVGLFQRDLVTGTLSERIDYATMDRPHGADISPDSNFLYVTNYLSNTISMYPITKNLYTALADNSYTEWPVNKYLYFNNKPLAIDNSATLFSIDSSTYRNGTNPVVIVRSFRAPPSDMKRVAHHAIQVDCEVGIGDVLLTEPVIALRWSDDAGNTWSTPIERGLGLVGDHAKSVIFRRLGSTKGIPRLYELSCDENVKITLLDCYLE